jgi:hypothetical protein
MIGLAFESPEDHLEWIQGTFPSLPKLVLEKVVATWMERLETCIRNNGADT